MKIKTCIEVTFSVFAKQQVLYTDHDDFKEINRLIKSIAPTAYLKSLRRVTISNEDFLKDNLNNVLK